MNSIARCHLRMGNWTDAMKAAEIVMSKDRKNINAIQIKAESLYNSCFFEHALVLFHRGQVRTGKIQLFIQKLPKNLMFEKCEFCAK